jgi:hypothetical protein
MMTGEELLANSFVSLQADSMFSEAVLLLRDDSRLCFCHRVRERWTKAVGPDRAPQEAGTAGEVLALIARFRLNAKHLDVAFVDGTRWELRFSSSFQVVSPRLTAWRQRP